MTKAFVDDWLRELTPTDATTSGSAHSGGSEDDDESLAMPSLDCDAVVHLRAPTAGTNIFFSNFFLVR